MYLWLLRNFDTSSLHLFTAEHLAMHAAEKRVGNRSVILSGNGALLYGPGDGTVSIMIERITRENAIMLNLDGIPPQ